MIYAIYIATPERDHPQSGRIGEACIGCWLRVRSFAEARRRARRFLRGQHWKIEKLEEIRRISPGVFGKRDSRYQYYRQALVDTEVYVSYTCPLFPLYHIQFKATALAGNARFPQGTRADVEYWVSNETVDKDADVFDNFWAKARHVRSAVSRATKLIRAEGWRVTEKGAGQPVNQRSFSRSRARIRYCDEAEEFGDCLVFYTG